MGHGVESATLSSVVPDLWLCTVQGCTAKCIQSSVMEQLVRYRRTRGFLANHTKLQFDHKAFEFFCIPFCRTRCGMTLRDFSRPNTIVEAG